MSCLPCEQARKALEKVGNIANGYGNLALSLVVSDSEVERVACKRMEICVVCPNRVPLVKVAGKQYYNCNQCHCPLDAATRSTGYSCPIGKW